MRERNNKKHLIIGAGEVGKSLYNVLGPHYDIAIRDKDEEARGEFDVLHICYPLFENFVNVTKKYIEEYKPELVIVHSTVPVGTTRKIGALAVHSPIRGVHPRLEEGIKMFVKYFGGEKAKEAARYFSDTGIKTRILDKPETTDLLKIFRHTYHGLEIVCV